MKKNRLSCIAITTGDVDGIGMEVASAALPQFKKRPVVFFLWRSARAPSQYYTKLKTNFDVLTYSNFSQAFDYFSGLSSSKLLQIQRHSKKPILIDIASNKAPPFWVIEAGQACFEKKLHGMVTGPLSKTTIERAGIKALGHNEILKRISKTKITFMGFLGQNFGVILATGHIPISKVSSSLRLPLLKSCLLESEKLRKKLKIKAPIKFLGLNPHAGELGLIGSEELQLFSSLKRFAKNKRISFEGPLVPDVAFQKRYWEKEYCLYISLYHDQGLIPFKLVHGQNSGYQISLGLPFLRTSVDHGTAKDIYNLSIANSGSMRDSIEACFKMITT